MSHRYDLAVYIGRFQPFHDGHLACVRQGARAGRASRRPGMTANLINLSASGGAFRSVQSIAPEEELDILVSSPNPRIEPLLRRARVARVSQDAEGRLIAVEFVLDQD